jgi:hypothetical protein
MEANEWQSEEMKLISETLLFVSDVDFNKILNFPTK